MKYLFVHDHVLNSFGGDYYSNGGLSNEVMKRYLFKKNDTITLYTRQKKIDKKAIKKLVKVNDKRVSCKPSIMYSSPKDYYKRGQIIKKEIRKLVEESDLIILRIPSFLGYFTYSEVLRQNKKYILEMVACPWDSLWNHSSFLGKLLAPFMYWKTKKVCKEGKNIIYVSNEFLQKRYPTSGKNVAISNVNLTCIDESNLEKRIRKIKDNKETFKIGLIGSLDVNFKGHYEAIQMATILKNKGYKFEVHFLGGGNPSRWQKQISKLKLNDYVFFDGTLPSGEPVLNWLDDIDIYIIPSLQEGLPRALIEAMSRGCPAVGMKTGGIPELIDNDFICERRNYKTLASKVELLIQNKEKMIEQAKKNYENSKNYLKSDLDARRKKFFYKVINK